jgi:hypothetical protein
VKLLDYLHTSTQSVLSKTIASVTDFPEECWIS